MVADEVTIAEPMAGFSPLLAEPLLRRVDARVGVSLALSQPGDVAVHVFQGGASFTGDRRPATGDRRPAAGDGTADQTAIVDRLMTSVPERWPSFVSASRAGQRADSLRLKSNAPRMVPPLYDGPQRSYGCAKGCLRPPLYR